MNCSNTIRKYLFRLLFQNKNYGILLDSYSLCRFGNPNDYSQLTVSLNFMIRQVRKGRLPVLMYRKKEKLWFVGKIPFISRI